MVEWIIKNITAPFRLNTPWISINWEHQWECTKSLEQIIDELSKIEENIRNDKWIVYDIALTKNWNWFDIWTWKRRKSLMSFWKTTIPQFVNNMSRRGWNLYWEHKIAKIFQWEGPVWHHLDYITKDLPKLFEHWDKILLISKNDFGSNYKRNAFLTFVKDWNKNTWTAPQLVRTLS